jgi:hypothetical protein
VSGEVSVPQKAHATLGASVASRWMPCPGSIRLSREVPVPPSSAFAQEGTQAHSVAELALSRGVRPEFFIGMEIEGAEVTEEMAEHVAVYVTHCQELKEFCAFYWIERKFNLGSLNPPGPMYGTADFVAYDATSRTLYVCDLKYGQGVVVEAKGNKQLRYYALGAALSLDSKQYPIDNVVMHIVQPRAYHPDGVIREDTLTFEELVEFGAELMAAARRTMDPNAPLVAGDHCKFCPASGVCPEQRDRAQALAQIEFDVVPNTPPAPETMPIELVVEMMPQLDVLENWIKAMRGHVLARLEAGLEVPGYKLVAKRPTRRWTDESGVEQILKSDGYLVEEIAKTELKSPAQIEKLLGKKNFAAALGNLVEKKSSGHKMAPASDPAPAITVTRGEEFDCLPAVEATSTGIEYEINE